MWPHEVEDLLRTMSIPSAALETSLDTYTDLLCSLLDIPVYKSRIQVNFRNKTKYFRLLSSDKVGLRETDFEIERELEIWIS